MLPHTISDFESLKLPDWVSSLLLDLDNTCYSYEPCHLIGLAAAQSLLESSVGPIPDFLGRYTEAQKKIKGRIPTLAASHSRILYFQALLEEAPFKTTATHCYDLEQLYWKEFMKTMVPTVGVIDFLKTARSCGVKVVIVSDLTTAIQCEKINRLGLTTLIDALVTSEETGAEKPDPRCFKLALEKIGATAQTAVMIGDSQVRDIAGAQAVGIPTILFSHEDQTPARPIL